MSKMASQFVTVTNKEISQINEEAVPDNMKIVTKFVFFTGKSWSV